MGSICVRRCAAHVRIHIFIYIHTHRYIYTYVQHFHRLLHHLRAHTCMYIHTHTHTHTHTYNISTDTFADTVVVNMCVCVYMYIIARMRIIIHRLRAHRLCIHTQTYISMRTRAMRIIHRLPPQHIYVCEHIYIHSNRCMSTYVNIHI